MDYSPEIINRMFEENLNSETMVKEAADMFSDYIRDKLRDIQFSRKIIPPRNVTQSTFGMQRSVNHDEFVFMDEIEPESGAGAVTWTSAESPRYIQAKRYEIPFFRIGTDKNQVTQQELWASRIPIHKMIEKRAGTDIGDVEDLRFLTLCETAVAQTGKVIKGSATNAGSVSGDIEPDDILALKNQIVDDQRPALFLLINDTDFNKLLKWQADDVGTDSKPGQVYGNAVPTSLYQLKVIRTAKTKLLTQGNLWCFSSPEFLGRFLILNKTEFFLKKEFDHIIWATWEFVAQSIANYYSLAKLELYSGASQALPDMDEVSSSLIDTPPTAYPTVVTY